jgi:hypothetical protein
MKNSAMTYKILHKVVLGAIKSTRLLAINSAPDSKAASPLHRIRAEDDIKLAPFLASNPLPGVIIIPHTEVRRMAYR